MDDGKLVIATLRGDGRAFEQLVRAHQRGLVAAARQIIRQQEDAEDLAQDAFIEAYRSLPNLQEPGKFRAWLFAILRNKCYTYLQRHHPEELPLEDYSDILADPTPLTADMPLAGLIEQLPLFDREILAARYLQDLSYREIAGVMGITEEAARVRCLRARARLRTLAQQEKEEELVLSKAMASWSAGLAVDLTMRVMKGIHVTPLPPITAPLTHATSVTLKQTLTHLMTWKTAVVVMGVATIAGLGTLPFVLQHTQQPAPSFHAAAITPQAKTTSPPPVTFVLPAVTPAPAHPVVPPPVTEPLNHAQPPEQSISMPSQPDHQPVPDGEKRPDQQVVPDQSTITLPVVDEDPVVPADLENVERQLQRWAQATTNVRYGITTDYLLAAVHAAGKPGQEILLKTLSDEDVNKRKASLRAIVGLMDGSRRYSVVLHWLEGSLPPIAFIPPWRNNRDRIYDPRFVEPLLHTLHDGDQEVQAFSAFTLGRVDDPRVIEPLAALLTAQNTNLRRAAAEGLGASGNARALEPLITACQDPTREVADVAFAALLRLEDVRDPTPLLTLLQKPGATMQMPTVDALGMLGDAQAVEPLITLLTKNRDESGGIREHAALALGLLGDDRAVEPLLNTLDDRTEWVRSAAAWALGKIGDRRAIEPLAARLNPADNRFQVRLATSLIELGDARGWPALASAMASTDNMTRAIGDFTLADHPDLRAIDILTTASKAQRYYPSSNALMALAAIKDPLVVDAVQNFPQYMQYKNKLKMFVLLRQGQPTARDQAISILADAAEIRQQPTDDIYRLLLMLATIDDPEFIEPVAALLPNKEPIIRLLAARVLALRKDPRGIPTLLAALTEPRKTLCYAVANRALCEIDPQLLHGVENAAVSRAVVTTLAGGTIEQRMQVAETAGRLKIAGASAPLLVMLKDGSSRLREAGARGLGALGEQRAVQPLITALWDSSSRVRVQAATALGKLNHIRAVPPLISILQTEQSTRLRDATAMALRNITGKDFGEDAEKWQVWWERSGKTAK
ncbi:MAG: sigma-70 family RNA polymerase sigma factor [Armatimonadota bacterium]